MSEGFLTDAARFDARLIMAAEVSSEATEDTTLAILPPRDVAAGGGSGDADRWYRGDPAFRGEPGQLGWVSGERWVFVPPKDLPPVWWLAAAADALRARGLHETTLRLDVEALGGVWIDDRDRREALVGWVAAQYSFDAYRSEPSSDGLRLVVPPSWANAGAAALPLVQGQTLARDLINTPPNDLMPVHLAVLARDLAARHAAGLRVVLDDEALESGFPCVAAVGRASRHSPRVIEMSWGLAGDPHWVLVGKGVCFDSGGLNLKPGSSMRLMKKDMGGAAIALGLAHAIMSAGLRIRLTVLVGAVENAVSGDAFRPGDVLRARNGKSIEIDNTDAEGRLVLADLLVRAGELGPDRVIDFATLTGAARVAVGTEISALFAEGWSRDEVLDLLDRGQAIDDPVALLPLHAGYRYQLDSDVADLVNSTSGGYAGAITAALFLKEFAPLGVPWMHLDLMAFNLRDRPGRPKGGEAMALRTLFDAMLAANPACA